MPDVKAIPKSTYPNWEEAARASKYGRAITAKPTTIVIPRGTFRIHIVKPLHGDPQAVYATAQGIRVHDWRPSSTYVDRIRVWKAW